MENLSEYGTKKKIFAKQKKQTISDLLVVETGEGVKATIIVDFGGDNESSSAKEESFLSSFPKMSSIPRKSCSSTGLESAAVLEEGSKEENTEIMNRNLENLLN